MTALTADEPRQMKITNQRLHRLPVAASTTMYKGGLVCIDADGYAIPAADTAGLSPVVGVATEGRDNSSGADGDLNVEIASNVDILIAATGVTQTMVGQDMMYVEDDNLVDDAAGVTNLIAVGVIVEFISTTSVWVHIPTFGVLGTGATTEQAGKITVTIVGGGSAGDHTVAGMEVGDEIIFVGHFSTASSIASLGDLTSEFTAAAGAANNGSGTETSSDTLMIMWRDLTP